MAISMVFRLGVAEVCALVSVRSPISHYSMLDCVVSSRRAPPTLEVGGLEGEGVAEAMTSHWNDCSPFWTEGSPVSGSAKDLPPSASIPNPYIQECNLGE